MDSVMLKKVHHVMLEILREVRRVCEENQIRYFLCCGTFLGAVRHEGFIPWDDDLDIGMLREDYEKFCRIAPEALNENFCLQSWYTEENYALPFAKVRMKNTLYQEAKGSKLREQGFYIDVFPFDYAPETEAERAQYARRLNTLFRMKLMKSGAKPWMDHDRIIWKKRLGYLPYQAAAAFFSSQSLAKRYDALAMGQKESGTLCRQRGLTRLDCYDSRWYQEFAKYPFENDFFPGPKAYEEVLRSQFGDYQVLPPENERENRHQIVRVQFAEKE